MDAILKRTSVRRFKEHDVSNELIEQILTAGMSAPSAGNQQPWQFMVIRNEETLKRLSQCSPYAASAAHAPVAILVCGDLSAEIHKGFWVQDCSAAVENMLIAVTSLNLGAVWLGVYPEKDRVDYVKKLFDLPHEIIPLAIIPVGSPYQEHHPQNRFDREKIHIEQW